jgi:hypothetical protein
MKSLFKRSFDDMDIEREELTEQVESLSLSPRKKLMSEKMLLVKLRELKIKEVEPSILQPIKEEEGEEVEFDPLGLKKAPNTWFDIAKKYRLNPQHAQLVLYQPVLKSSDLSSGLSGSGSNSGSNSDVMQ